MLRTASASFGMLRKLSASKTPTTGARNYNTAAVLKISSLSKAEVLKILDTADKIKAKPLAYKDVMANKTLLMLFEKPSLRTRVSFETGMQRMGGAAIFYSVADSPLGKKESMADTAECLSRYVDVIMARLNKRADIEDLAKHASVPVINGLDDWAHPCQMLADLQAIREKKGDLSKLTLSYLGDIRNNVTYDLMRAGALVGMNVRVGGPSGQGFDVDPEVLAECEELGKASGASVTVHHDAMEAVKGADIVYTDSWMSYHISKEEEAKRIAKFKPFQVTPAVMEAAAPNAIFMNCLPAARGMEQTADVIDNPKWSIVFDQAENRMWAQNALLMHLLTPKKM